MADTISSPLFPLPQAEVEGYLQTFGRLGETELAFVQGANLAGQDPTDPAHHLLTLAERPDLRFAERAAPLLGWESFGTPLLYRAAACAGIAIMRQRIDTLLPQDPTLAALRVEPGRRYLAVQPRGFMRFVVPGLEDLAEAYSIYGYKEFLEDPRAASTITSLWPGWLKRNVPFIRSPSPEYNSIEWMSTALTDTFRLFDILHREALARQVRASRQPFSSLRHLLRIGRITA